MMKYAINRATLPVLMLVALMATALGFTDRAVAQGMFGTLPSAISSEDLDGYAEQLDLSDQQVLAISEHHRMYLEQFRALRESDIDQFLSDLQEMRRSFSFSNFSRFEPMIRDINRLMDRIKALDEQFFGRMQAVLTEEQTRSMLRLRQRRERARYSSEMTRGMNFINPGARLDLFELIDQLDLSPSVLDRIDPHLAQYENRLTTMARSLWQTTTKTLIEAVREVDALGLGEQDMTDAAQMMRLAQEGQRIWDEVSEDMLEASAELAALHRRSFRDLAPMLPGEAQRQFRRRYLQQAYPEASGLTVEPWQEVEKALALDDLPPRLRTTVQAMAMGHDQQQERRIQQIADLLDEFRSNFSAQQLMRWGEDPTMQRVGEIREAGQEADQRFIENLHATLGEPWSARVKAAPAPRRSDSRQPEQRFWSAFQVDESSPPPGLNWPRPISAQELVRIGERLGLNEGRSAVLESLHEDYTAAYGEARRQHMPVILRMMVDPENEAGFMRILDDDALDELIDMVAEAIDELRAIEEHFFDDINSALLDNDGGETLDRLRAQRACQLHLEATPEIPPRLIGGPMNNPGNTEGGVNLAQIISEFPLNRAQRADLDDVLIDHAFATSDLLRRRLDVDVEISLRNWQIALLLQDRDERGRGWRAMRTLRDPMRESQSINRELAHMNRAALHAAIEHMPSRERATLRERYNRQAFPTVYDDPTSPEPKLLAAMRLTELSERQRGRVQDLMMNFRAEYQTLSQELVERYMDLSDVEVPERRDRRRRGESLEMVERDGLRNAIERIRFDRDELNQRVHRQLRAILDQDQYQRLSMSAAK